MLISPEGFRYHHAEPDYLMLVCWLPETMDTIPQNASHRVGVGAFVMNNQREVCSGVFDLPIPMLKYQKLNGCSVMG